MSGDATHNSSPSVPGEEPERHFWTQNRQFSARMETAFQAEVERMRTHRIERTGLAAIALYGAFALSDRVMIPDAWEVAWAIRFLLVIPLMLAGTFSYRKLASPLHRELVLAVITVASGASLPVIAALSTHPNAAHYQTGITLVVLFANIVLAQRLRSATMTSVVLGIVLYSVSVSLSYSAATPSSDVGTLVISQLGWMLAGPLITIGLATLVALLFLTALAGRRPTPSAADPAELPDDEGY